MAFCTMLIISIFGFLFSTTTADRSTGDFPATLLRSRQTNAPGFVDPVTIPACFANVCWWHSYPPPEICPLVDGPCANNSDATDNGGDKCGMKQYTRDCYCSLKTGLYCAWSCSWESWWDTEDWFAELCPDSPALKLDFSGLPDCARNCLDDASFEYGCLTQTSNCFCSNGDLFGCHDKCGSSNEWRQIENWLQDACDISPTAANEALKSGTFALDIGTATESAKAVATETKGASPPKLPPRKKPTWDEDFIFAVLGLTLLTGVALWIYSCVAGRRRRGVHMSKRETSVQIS